MAETDPTKTYSQADVDAAVSAAVASAVAPLQAKVAEFDAAKADEDVEAKIAAAVEPLNTQVSTLQAQLDAAEVAKQAEKDRADGLVAWLEEKATEQAEAAAAEGRKATRSEQAKQAGITDEYLAAGEPVTNLDRFVAMSDESWAATVDGWNVQRAAAGAGAANGGPPNRTAMTASAEGGKKSVLAEAAEARIAKTVDLRSLTSKR